MVILFANIKKRLPKLELLDSLLLFSTAGRYTESKFHANPSLQSPDITVNSTLYTDDFLLAYMRIFRSVADGKKAGELISVRSADHPLDIFRLITDRYTKRAGQSFRRRCQQNIFHSRPR